MFVPSPLRSGGGSAPCLIAPRSRPDAFVKFESPASAATSATSAIMLKVSVDSRSRLAMGRASGRSRPPEPRRYCRVERAPRSRGAPQLLLGANLRTQALLLFPELRGELGTEVR